MGPLPFLPQMLMGAGDTGLGAAAAPPPAAPAPHKPGLADLIPQLITAFAAGQAVRQRDPATLSNIIMDFARAQDLKKRQAALDEAARLRQMREDRLAEASAQREERMVGAEEARNAQTKITNDRNQANDLNTLVNQIEDNFRSMFSSGGEYNPAATGEYINQQSARVKGLGGDPSSVEALLMSLGTNLSAPPKQVPYIERSPETPAPATVPKGAVVRNAPRKPTPREPLKPNAYTTTDEDGNVYRVIEDPRTGKEISRAKVGKRPKPQGSGRTDALDKIIQEATGGGGAPTGAPAAASKTVTQAELAAIAKKRGTTVEQERARAAAEGFVVR